VGFWGIQAACASPFKGLDQLTNLHEILCEHYVIEGHTTGINISYSDKCTLFMLFNTVLLKNAQHVSNQFMVHLQRLTFSNYISYILMVHTKI
jgi:hypothetical protein